LVDEQLGFRKNLATGDVIYKLTYAILRDWNNKSIVGGIFCDLEKVFDPVNRDILLSKLTYYVIIGKAKG
jgi:hypothetical protein